MTKQQTPGVLPVIWKITDEKGKLIEQVLWEDAPPYQNSGRKCSPRTCHDGRSSATTNTTLARWTIGRLAGWRAKNRPDWSWKSRRLRLA